MGLVIQQKALGPLEPSAQTPSDSAHLIEPPVEVGRPVGLDVPPIARDVQGGPNFLRGPTSGRKPSPRIPRITPTSLCDIQHHTLRSPLQLLRQRLVLSANRMKKGLQLSHDPSCSVVNVLLSHERLLGLGLGLTKCDPNPIQG
jgi:hypothetical protein